MYPYGYYPEYLPVQPETYVPYDYSYIEQPDVYDIDRQPPQFQGLERRIRQLERQNEDQTRELARQNREINRINQEISRLNQNDERHTRRLNRINQRLRAVENRLQIPFSAQEDGF